MKKNTSTLRTALGLFVATIFASSCSDEPKIPAIQPNLPGSGKVFVASIKHSGNIHGSYDWTFQYKDSRLTQAVGTLYNPTNIEVQYTSQLSYTPDSIAIKNTNNLAMYVSLNTENLVERLYVNRDEYRFTYSEGRLVAWNKTIKDQNFGAEALHAHGEIEYKDGNITCITYYENNDDPIYYRCTPSNFYNTNGLLPETLSKQMGCFGFEHLYYAGLLGRATKNLINTIQVDYPEESKKEDFQVNFNYSTNKEDQISLCTFILDGEAVSVNYEY